MQADWRQPKMPLKVNSYRYVSFCLWQLRPLLPPVVIIHVVLVDMSGVFPRRVFRSSVFAGDIWDPWSHHWQLVTWCLLTCLWCSAGLRASSLLFPLWTTQTIRNTARQTFSGTSIILCWWTSFEAAFQLTVCAPCAAIVYWIWGVAGSLCSWTYIYKKGDIRWLQSLEM